MVTEENHTLPTAKPPTQLQTLNPSLEQQRKARQLTTSCFS